MSYECSSPDPARSEHAFEPWDIPGSTQVRIVEDLQGLLELEPAWNALSSPNGHPLRQFAWVRACAEAFEDETDLRVIVVERGGKLRAVAPMVERRRPTERLELLGARELHAPCQLLYSDTAALHSLAEAIAHTDIAVALDGFPSASPMLSVFEEAYQGRGWVRVLDIDPMPYIELDGSWADPEARLDPGLCSDLRRVLHHAGAIGDVRMEVVTPDSPEALVRLLSELKGGTSPWTWSHASRASKRGKFLRRYAAYAAARGILRLVLLRIGERPVALQLAIEAEGRYWVLHMCYDDQFARFLPSMLVTVHTIGYAAARGLRSYEFLGEPETWAKRFTDNQSGCKALRSYPLNGPGYTALCADVAQSTVAKPRGVRWS
ncbi:MAG TPA: GNAT family N-acetyltransferase [Usitatibacter sp.]|nr:GNAT family N-acetyltransferase [Usitatibacter sp.]